MSGVRASIIIPYFNRERTLLERCVNSVLEQTLSDIECIIVDDGSNTEYASMADEFEKLDTRIKVFHKDNGGAGSSRNYGVTKASGDYVYFLDSDDYISPYAVKIGMELADEHDADMVIGGLIHVEENEDPSFADQAKRIVTVESNADKEALIMHFSGIKQSLYEMEVGSTGTSPCSRFVKREVAEKVKFENDKYWDEDDLWNMSLVNACQKIVIADVCWYAYIINPDSMVRAYAGDRTKEFQYRAVQEYERMKELWPNCMQGAYYHVWDGLLRYCRTDTFQSSNPNSKEVRYKNFCNAIDFEEFSESIKNIDFNYERRFKYRFVKKTIRRLLMFKNKKLAYKALAECNKRIRF